MTINEVSTPADRKAFLDVARELYRNDPNWVCPLEDNIESVFDPARNPFHKDGSCTRWVLRDGAGKLIGRIAAFVNGKKAWSYEVPTGGCGFFECADDRAAAKLLFDTARDWLKAKGMKAMEGPINFGENDMWWGLLVEGFTMPYYGLNYNPPYYRAFFEDYGFTTAYEQISNRIDIRKPFPERFTKIANWVAKKGGYTFRHLDMKDFGNYAKDFMEVYNDGWDDFAHFTPIQEATVYETFRKMKPVADENLIWFAYNGEEPIAFVVLLPDTNELIRSLNGKLNLLGKLKFVWNKITVKHKRMRAVVMGTKHAYRNQGVESALFVRLKEYVVPLGTYQEVELSWVGDFNKKMIAVHQATGAEFAKRHVTYSCRFAD
jgi:GNAT superfamily N-acetyltransferase